MNTVGSDVASWIYQQDYMTFLAVLGWLTTCLIAWGNAAAATERRPVAWKWFAAFCFLASVDGTLDLARMVTPELWPRAFDPVIRLIGYGLLLEFARRTAVRLRWARLRGWIAPAVTGTAIAIAMAVPDYAPIPTAGLACLAGVAAAVVIIATVDKPARPLLATAAALLLIGPVEMLRSQGGVAIDGLYGLLITGSGFQTALSASVLAWVASLGLWLHGVLRRRSGLFAGRPEAFSPLAAVILPGVLTLTLATGFVLVNWSSTRVRHDIERDYLNRVRTAALAVDAQLVKEAAPNGVEADGSSEAFRKIRRQLRALRSVSQDLLRVYLWTKVGERPVPFDGWQVPLLEQPAILRTGTAELENLQEPQLIGPLGPRETTVILATAPIVEPGTQLHPAWLGLDLSAREWLTAQASVRLQTIALVGLFASLVVFFLAHQLLREHEAELLVGKERAEAADRAKDEFLAVMSHEIRTPMQSVLGYSELLARTRLTSTQTGYLETIRGQGRTLLRIVQDILDFSVLRKSSYNLKREVVFLHRLAQTAFESIKPIAHHKGLRYELTIGNSVPEVVRGDGVRIEQILRNLLNNAVKFTDRGGVQLDVWLERVELEPDAEVHWVLFSVSDTGMGIRQADVRRLFQPFTRLAGDEGPAREGAGLGLAIVKRLCELMGGRIDLESEWGRGTRFFVRLPLPTVEEPAEGEAVPAEPLESPRGVAGVTNLGAVLPLRILVAEDNPYIRRLMIEYLHSIGYSPVAVGSGTEAAARWREFDLLIMDLRMPGMDGVTAAARIRAEAQDGSRPWIIGVSATLSEAETERAMEAGMNDFLGKPFFVQSLIEAIQASPLFSRRSGEPSAPVAEAKAESEAEVEAEASEGTEPSPEPLPAGGMSWMPDLSASGDNELVQQAVAEIPVVIDEIAQALAAADLETAADRSHYLKNTIFALRMEPMIVPCRSVYERSSAGDIASATQSLETLRAAFAEWTQDRARRMAPGV